MGHGYGLNHSYAEGGIEYGDLWDIMSWRACWTTGTNHEFRYAGPGLIAPQLEQLGWLPWDSIYTYGLNWQGGQVTVNLRALNHPGANGHLMARVPFDEQDSFHYYTVERIVRMKGLLCGGG